jgi:hypothetical protein
MKAVLIRISTQEIIRKNVLYPSLVIEPIQSLGVGLKWLLVNRLERPVFDSAIEKLVKVEEITTEAHPDYSELDQFKIYFNVVALSQEEIDEALKNEEEKQSVNKNQLHLQKGEELFKRCYSKIWRRKHRNGNANNKLTRKEARDLMEWFQPTYLWLQTGNFHQAKKEITNNGLAQDIASANVVGMTNTYEWFLNEIVDYFSSNYDL